MEQVPRRGPIPMGRTARRRSLVRLSFPLRLHQPAPMAGIGLIGVLLACGQNLQHHPLGHCVVPGGRVSPEGARWSGVPLVSNGRDPCALDSDDATLA